VGRAGAGLTGAGDEPRGIGETPIGRIARRARFDAIVNGVMMPNMTGIELLEPLQRMAPDRPSG
jgi:CheY-like chemotaxis protein